MFDPGVNAADLSDDGERDLPDDRLNGAEGGKMGGESMYALKGYSEYTGETSLSSTETIVGWRDRTD